MLGVSAGGFDALSTVVPALPADFPAPLVVVQHRRPNTDDFLAVHLDRQSPLTVKEANDKEPLRRGVVYLAPGGYHLLIERGGTLALSQDRRVNHCRPSIDVLFDSAADVFGRQIVGVVLTGSNADGSRGLRRIKRGGIRVLDHGQTAASDCMPRAAIAATDVDRVLPVRQIAPFLVECFTSKQPSRIKSLEETGIVA